MADSDLYQEVSETEHIQGRTRHEPLKLEEERVDLFVLSSCETAGVDRFHRSSIQEFHAFCS